MIHGVGSINLDLIGQVARLPAPGETVLGEGFSTAPGGKGANQSLAARRAGAMVSHIGCIGDDPQGDAAIALLRADGVDLRHVKSVPGPTGVAIILVDAAGENAISVFAGANARLTPAAVEAGLAGLSARDVVLVQQEIAPDCVRAALTLAARAGARSVFNTAPFTADTAGLAPLAAIVVSNEAEFERLAQTPPGASPAALRDAVMAWSTRHGRPVIVTLGAGGVLLAQDGTLTQIPAISIAPVDTVGAGDAYCGYLAAALERGETLQRAATLASIAAGLTCLVRGAQPAIPNWEQVTAYEAEAPGATGTDSGAA